MSLSGSGGGGLCVCDSQLDGRNNFHLGVFETTFRLYLPTIGSIFNSVRIGNRRENHFF